MPGQRCMIWLNIYLHGITQDNTITQIHTQDNQRMQVLSGPRHSRWEKSGLTYSASIKRRSKASHRTLRAKNALENLTTKNEY